MKVLVVDDDFSMLTSMIRLLEVLEHKVYDARNGVEAKELIEQWGKFDAIITDSRMPKMGGVSLLEWFRTEFEPVPKTRLIIISDDVSSPKIEALCLRYPDIQKLQKPFGEEILIKFLG